MIELKNAEVKIVSAGMVYYACMATVVGALSTAVWGASMAGIEGFSAPNIKTLFNVTLILGSIGGMVGFVVGASLDNVS